MDKIMFGEVSDTSQTAMIKLTLSFPINFVAAHSSSNNLFPVYAVTLFSFYTQLQETCQLAT